MSLNWRIRKENVDYLQNRLFSNNKVGFTFTAVIYGLSSIKFSWYTDKIWGYKTCQTLTSAVDIHRQAFSHIFLTQDRGLKYFKTILDKKLPNYKAATEVTIESPITVWLTCKDQLINWQVISHILTT